MSLEARPEPLALRIDDACERYEQARRSGRPLPMERVLAEADIEDGERPRLFRELLLLDLELRADEGEHPTPDDYLPHFPGFADLIRSAFEESRGDRPGAVGDGTEAVTEARYRIVATHDEGGLGRVFLARDETLGRDSALKEIKAGRDDPTARARFAREATLTGRLEHPGIVPVYGLGVHADGRPFYVMRMIRGQTLREAIARFHREGDLCARGPRSVALRELLRRFLAVCDAVAYAHSRGVVHRDLKPANVMLGDFGETLVVDWGLAKPFRDGRGPDPEPDPGATPDGPGFETTDRAAVGTAYYMSPEQAEGRTDEVGPASDVYSLGATLYDLLTGRPPFGDSTDVRQVLRRVVAGDFEGPRLLEPGIPRPLEAVCLKAMAPRPADRYATAGDLAADLARWLAGEPVSAWPEPWTVRARRWVNRHRTLASSLAAGLLVAAVMATALGWLIQRDRLEAEARARARVAAVVAAKAETLPDLLAGSGPDRERTVRLLEATLADPRLDPEARLRASLAVGPIDRGVHSYLGSRILDASLPMLPLIFGVLDRDDHRALVERLWGRLDDGRATRDERLRAACALAHFDPPASPSGERRWSAAADRVVADVLEVVDDDPSKFGAVATLLGPARRALFAPLADRFRAVPGGEFDADLAERRGIAASLLDLYAEGADEVAELIQDTLPGPRFDRYLGRLRDLGEPGRAALAAVLARAEPATLARAPDDPGLRDEFRARRKARVAFALLELGDPAPIWPLYRQGGDPTLRTELIHAPPRLAPASARRALRALLDRLAVEDDASARRALILALAEFSLDDVPPPERDALLSRLRDAYRDDPDAGVHGALDRLLRRRWGLTAAVERIDRALAGPAVPAGRGWYVNAEGQTFAIVRGPVEYLAGSPPDEPGRDDDEARGRRRIGRSFAIGTREVPVADFDRFLGETRRGRREIDEPEFRRFMPTPDVPVGGVDWYDAARYCNWLSRRDGLPESQWCYPSPIEKGMALDPALLGRTGYRLPTEAEWEYACRAGSTAIRPQGSGRTWEDHYCWFAASARGQLQPVGVKLPNDLGLFDMLGNAAEWTLDRYLRASPLSVGTARADELSAQQVDDAQGRVVRGGSILLPTAPRPADRDWSLPSNRFPAHGFRVARTLP